MEGARQRAGDLPFAGHELGAGEVTQVVRGGQEERYLAAGRIEYVLARLPRHRDGRARHDGETRQPPQEHQELGDPEVAESAAAGPDVGHVEARVEGRAAEAAP